MGTELDEVGQPKHRENNGRNVNQRFECWYSWNCSSRVSRKKACQVESRNESKRK